MIGIVNIWPPGLRIREQAEMFKHGKLAREIKKRLLMINNQQSLKQNNLGNIIAYILSPSFYLSDQASAQSPFFSIHPDLDIP